MKGMPTLDLEAAADAIVDRTDRAARGMHDVLDQAGETSRAAMAEASSILDRIQASAGHLGEILRSAGASAEMAGNATAGSIREARDKAQASAETARSKAEEAASIGDRAIRATAAMGEAGRRAVEDAGATIDRGRQVVGDAIGGSAAERLRGPRTSRRTRAGLLVAGVAGGAATTYFLDADRGAQRRKVALDRLRRWSRRASEALATTARTVRLRIEPLLATTSPTAPAGSTRGGRSSAKVAATRSSLPAAPTAAARP